MNYFPGEEKHDFKTVGQIKNTLQEVGVSVLKSKIKRKLYQSKILMVHTIGELQKHKDQIRVAKKHLRKLEKHPMDR